MNSSDREIVASLLEATGPPTPYARAGRLDLRTKFDRNGRVTELILGSKRSLATEDPTSSFWDLDASIGQLRYLRRLVLCHCQSLPASLCKLRSLEVLELHSCRGNQQFAPFGSTGENDENSVILPALTKLEHHDGSWDPQSMEKWMTWICRKNSMANLQHLHFSHLQENLLDSVVKVLSRKIDEEHISFRKQLRHLACIHCGMTDHGLQRLIVDVVPLYPNLNTVSVPANQIKSLQFLLAFEEAWKAHQQTLNAGLNATNQFNEGYLFPIFSSSLQTLNLQHNPIMKKRTNDPLEQQAFELLLKEYFPSLGSLSSWDDWDPPIEYLLRINRGGRVLIEGNRPSVTNDNACHTIRSRIPLSIWPTVLERAYKTSTRGFLPAREDATALFYLIRNGPVLAEIMAGSR